MRQVPQIADYLLIGDGKVARHLSHYFDRLSIPYSIWCRRLHTQTQLRLLLKKHRNVLLLINDDQIKDFYLKYENPNNQFIHFSGAFEHSKILGFHPLMSFGDDLYSLSTYRDIHFVGSPTEQKFRATFPQLKNKYTQIPKEQKALYHSLCVLSGNGTTLLWDLLETYFKELGIPHQALSIYLRQISKNIIDQKEGRLTGPWYRGDKKTIRNNKKALEQGPLLSLYQEFEKLTEHRGNSNEKRS